MSRIIKEVNPAVIKRTAQRCRERGIIIPTFRQLEHPEEIPQTIKDKLKDIGLWDVNPLNLFRITWKNDIKTGGFGSVNYIEIPREITGVKARIIGLVGKYFPTGAHKVGAAFGCLVPRLVSGAFDPDRDKAVWPSTGNYCRGGAFDCALLDCTAIAILPEEMSAERFTWLREIGAEVIATPGCESNVKEIYDKCWELRGDPTNVIFNQFDEFGNPIYHYQVTGKAIEEVMQSLAADHRLSAYISATGSAGTIAAGDYLRKRYPHVAVVATEALQCPTLFMNGFGGHRIEGIGDKHVPWVHNVRNTDAVAAIDDDETLRVLRLFNEPEGLKYLERIGISRATAERMSLLGISGVCNLLAAIKTSKYYEYNEHDVIVTIFTDSIDLYESRIKELRDERGAYTADQAAIDHNALLLGQKTDYFRELNYRDRKTIHNLKYYTWVEQQGITYEEILEQWNPEYWEELFEGEVAYFDELIKQFNREAGLI
ncbi:MAG: pyridoxal-phosphate dependent enzyme [Calditrichota bacterium]